MNEKRQMLLFKALKKGRIDITTANRLYSGNQGKDALMSLEFQDYLEHTGFGNFVPNTEKEFPPEVVQKYKRWKESLDEDSAAEEEESEYQIQQV